jgi:hypothetical protein
MDNDRRRAERYFFSAQAEVTESGTALRIHSRVSELSQHGCYLDMMNPFPANTTVKLKITAGDETFSADTRVVHATANIGSGIEFLEASTQDRALLDRWLRQAAL